MASIKLVDYPTALTFVSTMQATAWAYTREENKSGGSDVGGVTYKIRAVLVLDSKLLAVKYRVFILSRSWLRLLYRTERLHPPSSHSVTAAVLRVTIKGAPYIIVSKPTVVHKSKQKITLLIFTAQRSTAWTCPYSWLQSKERNTFHMWLPRLVARGLTLRLDGDK